MGNLTTGDYRAILVGIAQQSIANVDNPRVYEYWQNMQRVVSQEARRHEESTLKTQQAEFVKSPIASTVKALAGTSVPRRGEACNIIRIEGGWKCTTCKAHWDTDDTSPCEDGSS